MSGPYNSNGWSHCVMIQLAAHTLYTPTLRRLLGYMLHQPQRRPSPDHCPDQPTLLSMPETSGSTGRTRSAPMSTEGSAPISVFSVITPHHDHHLQLNPAILSIPGWGHQLCFHFNHNSIYCILLPRIPHVTYAQSKTTT
jgi:hypothetical protein